MILLICGSRDASDLMLLYTERCVERARDLHWSVICGDADGVDETVISECDWWGVPVMVYGAYDRIRHESKQGKFFVVGGDYLERDRVMALACDVCIGIWNGQSRGTKYTVDYAGKLGKTTHLMDFSKGEPREIKS